MNFNRIKTLIALLTISLGTCADQCSGQYASWDRTPVITSASRDTFSQLFRSAQNDTVRIALFGDSQETVRGGGYVYAPSVNLAFNDYYGNTPETPVIFSISENSWLYTSSAAGIVSARGPQQNDLLPGQVVGTFTNESPNLGFLASLRTAASSTPFADRPNHREFDTRNVGIEIIGGNSIGSGEIAWRVNVQTDDGVNYFGGNDIATGVTNLGLGNSNSGFSSENIGSFQIPAENNNIQLIAQGTDQFGSQIAGARFINLDDPSGVAVQSFAAGGYTLQRILNDHAGAEEAFRALGDYDAVTLHLGTNDSFRLFFGEPENWEDSLVETIEKIRDWADNEHLPIIISADPDSEQRSGQTREDYDLYPGVAAAVASKLNNVLALNTRRLAAEELGWIADTDGADPYLFDQVHYTTLGAQELARIEVEALVGLIAVPEPSSAVLLFCLLSAAAVARKRSLISAI